MIAQSGDVLSPWAVYKPWVSILPGSQYLADTLGCPTHPSQDMVDCLRDRDAMEIMEVSVPVRGAGVGGGGIDLHVYYIYCYISYFKVEK